MFAGGSDDISFHASSRSYCENPGDPCLYCGTDGSNLAPSSSESSANSSRSKPGCCKGYDSVAANSNADKRRGDDGAHRHHEGLHLENSAHHWQVEERRRPLDVVDDISGHPNVGVAIICQYRMAAVGIAGTTREIAAGDIDLEPMAGAKCVTDVAEIEAWEAWSDDPGAFFAFAWCRVLAWR
jgi:hypothetical protein